MIKDNNTGFKTIIQIAIGLRKKIQRSLACYLAQWAFPHLH